MERLLLLEDRVPQRHFWLPVLVIALLVLSACEEDQSAVPPGAVRDAATAVAEDPDSAADESDRFTGFTGAEFSRELLPPAEHLYFAYGGDLWQLPVEGRPEAVAEREAIASFSASAAGDRLAVLTFERSDDDGQERMALSIYLPDGESVFDSSSVGDDLDLDQLSTIESVAMNPDGDALAMTHQNGAMTLVTLDGDVQQLLPPSIEHRPGRMSWSPDGAFIAYLDPWLADEHSALYVVQANGSIREPLVQQAAVGNGVVRARWIPGTSYIAVARSSGSTIPHGGDLFVIDAETGYRELLMSSGEIAPVAGVVDFAPSPDGEWLAVTGFVPGSEYPDFAGLWVLNLQSGLRVQADISGAEPVTDIWWLGEHLVIRTIDQPRTSLPGTYTGREEFRLLEFDPDSGSIRERYPENAEPGTSDDS